MGQEEVSIPAFSNNIVISDEKELNTPEQEILSMLSSSNMLPNYNNQENTTNSIFYKTLQEYLSSSEVYLRSNKVHQIEEKIMDLQEIMSSEGETDFTKMSLEGKKVAIYISEQIYEQCNLKLVLNMEGNIEEISESSGDIIYTKYTPVSQDGFQIKVLIIILASMTTLLSICIIIAKKNQLFMKEVVYDGFDEERFA